MKHYYIDDKTGNNYTLRGNYYLPDLILPAEKENKSVRAAASTLHQTL